MTPAKLANWHLVQAKTAHAALRRTHLIHWLETTRRSQRAFHLAAALLVIAKSSGGNTRSDAARMLREMAR